MAQEPQVVKNSPRIKLVPFPPIFIRVINLSKNVFHVQIALNILLGNISIYTVILFLTARATLEILIPDFVKQTSEEKPIEGDELEVLLFFLSEITDLYL